MNMKRVLLINQGHTDNIGDQAIDRVMTHFLEDRGYTVFHAEYENAVENRLKCKVDSHEIAPRLACRFPKLMDYWNRKRILNILRDVGPIDAAIIGGGELLAGWHKEFNSAFVSWCRALRDAGVPILVVGVSGSYRKSTAHRYASALKLCDYISVRDQATQRMIQNNYNLKVDYAPDVVFSYRKVIPDRYSHNEHLNNLCIPMRFHPSEFKKIGLTTETDYVEYLCTQFFELKSDLPVVVSSTVMSDTSYPAYIAEKMKKHGETIRVEVGLSLDRFIELLHTTAYLVSARMHACILGMLFGCNIRPIRCSEKLEVFSQEYTNDKKLTEAIDASLLGLIKMNDVLSKSSIKNNG